VFSGSCDRSAYVLMSILKNGLISRVILLSTTGGLLLVNILRSPVVCFTSFSEVNMSGDTSLKGEPPLKGSLTLPGLVENGALVHPTVI